MAYISFQPKDYFDTKLYTQSGSNNNGNTQTLTMDNVGFVWVKNRDYTNGHCIFDILRGGDKLLTTNGAAAAETVGGGITFGASDTTIGADTGGYGFNNRVGDDYVGWHWRANGAGSSNTDGSINTTYTSASTTSGFSISTYTGTGSAATIGHGLGVAPAMIIVKRLTGSAEAWTVYHQSLDASAPQDKYLHLNTTDAVMDSAGMWNDTAPTTSVFSVGSTGVTNGSGGTFVAYCFAEKKGYSKFGSYTGNGNADGTFVYTGFKPAFVIIKGSSNTENWHMYDNKRDTFNPTDQALQPNTTSAEFTETNVLDFLSNGFKLRVTGGGHNGSGVSYIYMAFAESPIVSSNGVPAVAR